MNSALEKQLTQDYFTTPKKGDQRAKVAIGDTVEVYVKIKEKTKKKRKITAAEKSHRQDEAKKEQPKFKISIQRFKGTVIAFKGKNYNKTITVRKIAANDIGVERIFPLFSPMIDKIVITKKGNPRRAKLYYLRKRTGRKALRVKQSADKATANESPKTKENSVKDTEE